MLFNKLEQTLSTESDFLSRTGFVIAESGQSLQDKSFFEIRLGSEKIIGIADRDHTPWIYSRRQALFLDQSSVAVEDETTLDLILEFPDIARP